MTLGSFSLAEPATGAEGPEALAREALAANPGLEALAARSAELAALASATGTWADPVLAIEYLNAPVDSLSLNDHPMSALQLRLRQAIKPRGWSRLREAVAESRTRTSEHALAEARGQLRRDVNVLFWKLTLSRLLENVTRAHVDRTEDLLNAVRARYETGAAGQHQVLRLRVLRDRLRDDLQDFSRAKRELSAALRRSLAREPGASFSTPESVEPRPVAGRALDWLVLARQQRPELKRVEESIRTAEAGADLARIKGRPDVTLWVAYRARQIDTALDDGTEQVSAGVSVPIPWGSSQRSRAERSAKLQESRRQRALLAAELDQIEAELTTIHARWTRAFEQASVYRDRLTPDARTALESSFTDYRVGRADFSALYEAEVDLLELERTLHSATVQTHIQAAEAGAIIGAPPTGGQP